jgi:hypothetical protein
MASYESRGSSIRVRLMRDGRKFSKTFSTHALAQAWADRQEYRAAGMPMLRAALADHRIASLIPLRLRDAIGKANYSAAEILESAFPVDSLSGVYFLIRESTIYYVGQTVRVLDRLARHKRDGRKFDSFAFIPCPPEQLDELEAVYIAMLMPEGNEQF